VLRRAKLRGVTCSALGSKPDLRQKRILERGSGVAQPSEENALDRSKGLIASHFLAPFLSTAVYLELVDPAREYHE